MGRFHARGPGIQARPKSGYILFPHVYAGLHFAFAFQVTVHTFVQSVTLEHGSVDLTYSSSRLRSIRGG